MLTYNEDASGHIDGGSPGSPLVINYDGNAGAIEKDFGVSLEYSGDAIVSFDDVAILQFLGTPNVTTIAENLEVGPGGNWTAWNEDIGISGWAWSNVSFYASNVLIGSALISGGSATFSFPAFPLGTQVTIETELDPGDTKAVIDANVANDGNTNVYFSVPVLESPVAVPEPTSLCLIAIAFVGFACWAGR